MCERQKQHLLFTLGETESVWSSRANRQQRLHHLKATVLRISPRIKKRDHSSQPPRNQNQQTNQTNQRRRRGHSQVQQTGPGCKGNDYKQNRDHHCRSQIRFEHDQACERRRDRTAGYERPPKISFVSSSSFKEVRQEDGQREFCNLRRLNRKATQLDPAMSAVHSRKSKHSEQHHHCHNQQTVDDATVLKSLIVKLHCAKHDNETNQRPDSLLDHIEELVVTFVQRQHGRGAVHHHHTE